jgi:hypothetical protein
VEKDEKPGQLLAVPVHRDLVAFKVWQQFVQKNRGEKHHRAFVKVVVRSTTFLFTTYSTLVANFGVILFPTGPHEIG